MFLLPTPLIGMGAAGDADLAAWVLQVSNNGGTVGATRQGYVSTYITALKGHGLWAKLDRLWILAGEDQPSAKTDIVARQLATTANSPTFTANLDYEFNGSNQYIDLNYNTSTGGGVYVRDSSHIAAFVTTTFTWAFMGNYTPDSGAEMAYYSGQWHATGPQEDNAGTNNITASPSTGLAVLTRTGASARAMYLNGSSIFSDTQASEAAPANQSIFLGATSYIGGPIHPGAGKLALASFGSGFDATDNSNFYTDTRALLTSIGVP